MTFCEGGVRVSSTAVRQALADDELDTAENLLGHPFTISGRVVHGDALGRTIGFPTANIPLRRQVSPVKGSMRWKWPDWAKSLISVWPTLARVQRLPACDSSWKCTCWTL
jgi:riboflavin kinase/FMN adenylyltransferase